jgi:hypothetical protein
VIAGRQARTPDELPESGASTSGPLQARAFFLLALALLAVGLSAAITATPPGISRVAVGWILVAGVACLLLFLAANQPDPRG